MEEIWLLRTETVDSVTLRKFSFLQKKPHLLYMYSLIYSLYLVHKLSLGTALIKISVPTSNETHFMGIYLNKT